jgi:hypothetical protein
MPKFEVLNASIVRERRRQGHQRVVKHR